MATLALSLAGQVVGGMIGGPIGATIGRALGALAGNAVDQAIFGEKPGVLPGSDIRLVGSSEGGPIPRVFGWSRVSGNIIWATHLEKLSAQSSGSKGMGPKPASEDTIVASFALALCEGPVAHLGRIWADGKLLETDGLNIRFYRGTQGQGPDGFIAAKQGSGNVPGYRGLAYLVFERLPLKPFGNRIPNISVEICRPVGDLEPAIEAMCLIPGSTEFGYDPVPRVRVLGHGRTAPENTHVSGVRSDWDVSLDELTALCPNLKHVGLVVSWFGTDLRCGNCVVEPRVESKTRQVQGVEWGVVGHTRASANTVSLHAGGPAYGGTPSDAAVRAAIADLKARGIAVTLYPFVMMDIPAGNGLADPYTLATGQPAYPWRGRITCHPAPGVAGTPDKTGAAAAQVAAFMANGYRAMVLHYAQLAKDAGGVEAFLVGSEMRHLTWVRSGAASFPFVDALRSLAGEVRAILGAGTKITYAADWSEYFGFYPPDAPGDRIFHLDPLWADGNIDAVGIDNYMPLADWRDGRGHADAEISASIYETAYLKGNIAGGEGFDWYYASVEDRAAGVRTPISDGLGEPWVWRYKDLAGWWSQPHHNRIGGVRSGTQTAWVPAGKPIWLTELGCGAVDKGPNAPNAFGDPKSSEDARPPFSSGLPDPLVQRQALRACHDYWRSGGAGNPVSPLYGGPMVDPARLYLWCWDARPFPAFPGMPEVWADAGNYATGHWLNGRLGTLSIEELLRALAAAYGVPVERIDAFPPLVTGLTLEGVMSLRDAMGPLIETGGLVVRDGVEGIAWTRPDDRAVLALDPDSLQRTEGPLIARRRGDPAETVGRLSLSFFERARDYQAVTVMALANDSDRNAVSQSGLVLDAGAARLAAEGALKRLNRGGDSIETALPPSLLAVEAGDLVSIAGEADGPFVVTEIKDGEGRALGAKAHGDVVVGAIVPQARESAMPLPAVAVEPVFRFAHLPRARGGTELVAGAFAEPWPGGIDLRDAATGAEVARLGLAANLGVLDAPLGEGPVGIWSREAELRLVLFNGHLASESAEAVLAAANRIAIQHDDGGWEVIGFAQAELVAPETYRLGGLLRGLRGTVAGTAAAGNAVLVLDGRAQAIALDEAQAGVSRTLIAYAGPRDAEGTVLEVTADAAPALPLPPVHLSAVREASGDVRLGWIRRTRSGGDGWTYGEVPLDFAPEAYRVTIREGGVVKRSIESAAPFVVYSAGEQVADFGALPSGFSFTVEQVSAVLGPGAPAMGVFQ